MSEFTLNLWTTIAILAAIVLVADVADRADQNAPHAEHVGTALARGAGSEVRSAVNEDEAASTDLDTDDAEDVEQLTEHLAVYCEAHRDAMARMDDLGLEPAASAEDAVDATLEALASVTEHIAEVVPASVTGDLHPRVDVVVDAAARLRDETRRVLDDSESGQRRAFLLAQFDDASYLQPFIDDDVLLDAALDHDACRELALPLPGQQ